jgi:hypothetical protein
MECGMRSDFALDRGIGMRSEKIGSVTCLMDQPFRDHRTSDDKRMFEQIKLPPPPHDPISPKQKKDPRAGVNILQLQDGIPISRWATNRTACFYLEDKFQDHSGKNKTKL